MTKPDFSMAFVADVHLGNHKRFGGAVEASMNARCREGLAVFRAAAERAVATGVKAFVIAGDLFDVSRPEPALLAAVQEVLGFLKEHGVTVIALVGNHDMTSDARDDNAMAPLGPFAYIVYQPTVVLTEGLEVWAVPFKKGKAADWLPAALEECARKPRQGKARARGLVIHMGLRDAKTPPWLANSHDAIDVDVLAALCAQHRIDQVFAGNWHDRQRWAFDLDPDGEGEETWKVKLLQVGALVPTGFDNPGLNGYGGLALWDGIGVKVETIPGPRFVKVFSADEVRDVSAVAAEAGHRVVYSYVAPPRELVSARNEMESITSGGDFEVVPDQALAAGAAKMAASRAASADNLDKAIAAYVASMSLPEAVSRESLLARVRTYL